MKQTSLKRFSAFFAGAMLFAWMLAQPNNYSVTVQNLPNTNAAPGTALLITDQHFVGRTTNDTFNIKVDDLFTGRDFLSVSNAVVTNLYVQVLTALTNIIGTNIFVTTTNLYFTNLFASNFFGTNIFIQGGNVTFTNTTIDFDNSTISTNSGNITWTTNSFVTIDTNGHLATITFNPTQFNLDLAAKVLSIRNQPHITNAVLEQVLTVRGLAYLFPSFFQPNSVLMDVTGSGTLSWGGSATNPLPSLVVSNLTIVGNTNGVPSLNPTIGRYSFKETTNSLGDGAIYHINSTTAGVDEFDINQMFVTNLVAGGVVVSVPSGSAGYLTNLINGPGFLRNNGSGTLTWDSTASLWSDTAGVYAPSATDQNVLQATNIIGVLSLNAQGAFILQPPASQTALGLGANDLNSFDVGYMELVSGFTDPTTVQVRLATGNGPGALLLLQNARTNSAFEMLNGDALWDNPAKHLYLAGGNWVSTNAGETLLLLGTRQGWAEVGRFNGPTNIVTQNLWQENAGVLSPIDTNILHQLLSYRMRIVANQNNNPTLTLWQQMTNVSSQGQITFDATDVNGTGTLADLTAIEAGGWDVGPPSGRNGSISFRTQTGNTLLQRLVINGDSNGIKLYDNANNNYWTFANSGGLVWGPGTTNTLFRNFTDLYYAASNSLTPASFIVTNLTDASSLLLQAAGNIGIVRGHIGVAMYDAYTGGNEVRWFSGNLAPTATGKKVGGDQGGGGLKPWQAINSITNSVWGWIDTVSTNYQRLFLTASGTNSVINSDSSGTATNAPIFVQVGATNMLQIDGNSGASTTGLLIYENGTSRRVSIGSTDSGGTGFRVLRIPNFVPFLILGLRRRKSRLNLHLN